MQFLNGFKLSTRLPWISPTMLAKNPSILSTNTKYKLLSIYNVDYILWKWVILAYKYSHYWTRTYQLFHLGALNVPIFGGSEESKLSSSGRRNVKSTSTSLYDENLKFGAMPTHPLGNFTHFHQCFQVCNICL